MTKPTFDRRNASLRRAARAKDETTRREMMHFLLDVAGAHCCDCAPGDYEDIRLAAFWAMEYVETLEEENARLEARADAARQRQEYAEKERDEAEGEARRLRALEITPEDE